MSVEGVDALIGWEYRQIILEYRMHGSYPALYAAFRYRIQDLEEG